MDRNLRKPDISRLAQRALLAESSCDSLLNRVLLDTFEGNDLAPLRSYRGVDRLAPCIKIVTDQALFCPWRHGQAKELDPVYGQSWLRRSVGVLIQVHCPEQFSKPG